MSKPSLLSLFILPSTLSTFPSIPSVATLIDRLPQGHGLFSCRPPRPNVTAVAAEFICCESDNLSNNYTITGYVVIGRQHLARVLQALQKLCLGTEHHENHAYRHAGRATGGFFTCLDLLWLCGREEGLSQVHRPVLLHLMQFPSSSFEYGYPIPMGFCNRSPRDHQRFDCREDTVLGILDLHTTA